MPDRAISPFVRTTNRELIIRTAERVKKLEENYGLKFIRIKECQIKEELKKDEELNLYFKQNKFVFSLDLRSALFGGQTTVFKRYLEADEEWEIWKLDICSLYPSIQYSTPYPVEAPRHVRNVPIGQLNFDDNPGFYLVTVQCPTNEVRWIV